MLGKIFSRRHFEYFLHFTQKTGFDFSCKLSCKLSPRENIYIICQNLFSWKYKKKTNKQTNKKTISLSSAEYAQRVAKVKVHPSNLSSFVNVKYEVLQSVHDLLQNTFRMCAR